MIKKIKSLLSSVEEKILGPKEFELKRRLACVISFIFFIACVISLVLDIYYEFPILEIIFQIVFAIYFSFIYFFYKSKPRKESEFWILVLSGQLYFSLIYFTNGGLIGPVFLYFLLIFISMSFLIERKKWLYLFLFILNVFLLDFIENLFPELIYVFEVKEMKEILLSSIIFSFVFAFLIIRIVVLAYNDERTKVLNQKNEIEKQSNKIRELMEREFRINQMKLNFFTNISHEFRTPLTLLTAPVELLIENEKDIEKLAAYYVIRENTAQLNKLIDQILDLRKLDTENFKLTTVRKDAIDFVKNITFNFTPLAEVQKIDLRFLNFGNDPFIMAFDPEKLEKIVSNILLNAFKFTGTGGSIHVNATAVELENKKYLEIRISDTGKGIAKELTEDIFKPFYQAPDTMYGTGLGLSLANEYARAHGGYISVDSRINEGTVFSVYIPSDIEANTIIYKENANEQFAIPVNSESDFSSSGESETININHEEKTSSLLIVEDNEVVVEYVAKMLGKEYTIIKAYDGKEGFEKAVGQIPDMIISDVMMPEIDGVELCRMLKEDERTSHIPVILLTAKAAETDRLTGLETGADDYVTKPFSAKELKVRVKNLIKNREILRTKFQKNILSVQTKELVTNKTDEKFLGSAIRCVEENMENTSFGVPELINHLNISRTLLHVKLKKLTNMSASEFISAIRLKKAAKLLKQSEENISDICYKVGYSDLPHFSSSFKKMFGESPSEYRKKMK